jgi:exopolysaccharide biosynthesis operon protein EpsL
MVAHRVLHCILLAPTLFLGAMTAACAQTDQGLQLRASETLMHDSNLFRLSDSANVKESTGRDSSSDTLATTTLGLSYNKAYSLQRIELDVSLVDNRFQNSDYLNFTAYNYSAAWRWSLTPRLRGTLQSSRKEGLNSFSDYQYSTLRNLRTDTATGFDALYELTGAWRLLGGVSQTKQVNEQVLLVDSDYSFNSAFLGGRYDFSSGSTITYKATASSGSYLNRSLSAANLTDDGFDQTESDLRLDWVVSNKLTASVNAGYVQRSHPHFAQRDYSGLQGGASLIWVISGKTSLLADVSRKLGAYQATYANYARTDRLSVGPNWQISAKTTLGLSFDISHIDYLDSPFASNQTTRQDTVRDIRLSLAWQPSQSTSISASVSNATRSSTLPDTDYHSHIATLSAKYSY